MKKWNYLIEEIKNFIDRVFIFGENREVLEIEDIPQLDYEPE
jgi:hypothetical protein